MKKLTKAQRERRKRDERIFRLARDRLLQRSHLTGQQAFFLLKAADDLLKLLDEPADGRRADPDEIRAICYAYVHARRIKRQTQSKALESVATDLGRTSDQVSNVVRRPQYKQYLDEFREVIETFAPISIEEAAPATPRKRASTRMTDHDRLALQLLFGGEPDEDFRDLLDWDVPPPPDD